MVLVNTLLDTVTLEKGITSHKNSSRLLMQTLEIDYLWLGTTPRRSYLHIQPHLDFDVVVPHKTSSLVHITSPETARAKEASLPFARVTGAHRRGMRVWDTGKVLRTRGGTGRARRPEWR